jgi:carbonic anhydrase
MRESHAALDRRSLLRLGGVAAAGTLVAGCSSHKAAPTSASTPKADTNEPAVALSAPSALSRLQAGNARFVAGRADHPDQSAARRTTVAGGQHPFAQVLACVDSRVTPELVFDQGLGDLFVSRTAGQVVDQAVLGSIQFGTSEFAIPLIVVLGHSKCGAVKATIEAEEKHSPASGTAVDTLVAGIKPAMEKAEYSHPADLLAATVTQNVIDVVGKLSAAAVLAPAIAAGKLKVVGAVYDLATGKVDWQ